ncbi:MAG: reductive dehalogenase [Candidatus Dehalobacter alkaniphilus]|uniref:reductive dehalogenase n=1 Tax=Dehalobacter sp. UNSWDHB TaxID=1339256 RepID=UPI001FA7636C|nr:reductive dehalogenase [Dehalobacter sp. UNSWDHB]
MATWSMRYPARILLMLTILTEFPVFYGHLNTPRSISFLDSWGGTKSIIRGGELMSEISKSGGKEPKQQFSVSRRGFLRTGAAAAAMGVMGAIAAPSKVANAAIHDLSYTPAKGQWSKLRPVNNYGGATVHFVENNDQWLGTSKIVGPIKKSGEFNSGFGLATRGLLGNKAKFGLLSQGERSPLTGGIMQALGMISGDETVMGTPRKDKLPIPDPEQMSQHIKDLAYYLRADDVGIGQMPSYGYYGTKSMPPITVIAAGILPPQTPIAEVPNTEPEYPYVITVAVEQHLETYLASTGYDGISVSQSMRCYHATANIAVIMARYIRNIGYNARAHHFGNYGLAVPPALIASGLGEHTRTGDCVAHPRMGFRNKCAAVTTDLPLVADKPIDFGMLDFCRVCMKCAVECPSKAISPDKEPVEMNGYLRWNSDYKKCTVFRCSNEEGVNCGRCIKVCPWNSKENSWFHEAGLWIGSKGETASTMLKAIDDMFGYGTEIVDKYKWWLEWPELYKINMPS